MKKFDYLIIGGGLGGISSALRAAEYKVTVGLIESQCLGGTCVNLGCVPTKVMYNTAMHAVFIGHHADYGIETTTEFKWSKVKRSRDEFISQLCTSFETKLDQSNVEIIYGCAKFNEDGSVEVTLSDGSKDTCYGTHTLIAVGGKPRVPDDVSGAEFGITSEGFFGLDQLPNKTVVVGVGCVAVELASLLACLGSETYLISADHILPNFDLSQALTETLLAGPLKIRSNTRVSRIDKSEATGKLIVHLSYGDKLEDVDKLIWAIGREPMTDKLNLSNVGVDIMLGGYIIVNDYQNTSNKQIYAIGDACTQMSTMSGPNAIRHPNASKFELASVAIDAGCRLAQRLFNGEMMNRLIYENIPAVVFSHPPLATTGLSEKDALKLFGHDQVKTYSVVFKNMYFAVTERTEQTHMKIVCHGEDEKVVGLHILGMNADEMLQGFAVAVAAGLKKREFDECVAIHPTASEELVKMR